MSLAEIQGSPLATKMSTPIIPTPTPKVTYMSSVKTNVPVLTKTGIQNIGIKETYYPPTGPVTTFTIPTKTTTTVAPTQPQAPVSTITMTQGASAQDIIGGAMQTGWGATPMGALLNVVGGAWGLAGQLAGGTTKPVTVVEPKTSTTVNISQNPLMAVVKAGAEQRLGAWYMQNPAVQRMLAVARTGMDVSALRQAGFGNVYLAGATTPILDEIGQVLYGKELKDVGQIAEYQERQSTNLLQPLSKGTVEGIVAKEYLQNTTTIYERIIERFTEYINQGGGGTPEAPKGTDWGLIAIIGIVAIAGVLLLGSFIKRS